MNHVAHLHDILSSVVNPFSEVRRGPEFPLISVLAFKLIHFGVTHRRRMADITCVQSTADALRSQYSLYGRAVIGSVFLDPIVPNARELRGLNDARLRSKHSGAGVVKTS